MKKEKEVVEVAVPAPEVKPEGNIAFVGMKEVNGKKVKKEIPPYYRSNVEIGKKINLPEGLKWGEIFDTEYFQELMATGDFKEHKNKGEK